MHILGPGAHQICPLAACKQLSDNQALHSFYAIQMVVPTVDLLIKDFVRLMLQEDEGPILSSFVVG